jgi:UDP-N-acetylmuramoyl-L-alanyl-D-glutamate--2,6-diaminopimelate ligase
LEEIATGIPKTFRKKPDSLFQIVDRKKAIAYALSQSKPGDIVLIAGKGHERDQEIQGVKYPFDDRVVAKEILSGGKEW